MSIFPLPRHGPPSAAQRSQIGVAPDDFPKQTKSAISPSGFPPSCHGGSVTREFQSCSLWPLLFIALPAYAPAGRRDALSQSAGPTRAAFLEGSEPTLATRFGLPGESPGGNAAQSSARSRSRCSQAAQWLPRGQAERVRVCGRARVCGAGGAGVRVSGKV